MLDMRVSKNLYCSASLLFIPFLAPSSIAATSTWEGTYVGAYLGGGFGNQHASTNVGNLNNTSYFATQADINAVNNAGTSTQSPSSFIAGVSAGHDWAWEQLAFGIVIDYGALPLESSRNVNNKIYPDNQNIYSIETSLKTNWLFTLRGRLGYQTTLYSPCLLYVTGGVAMTQLEVQNKFNDDSSLAGLGKSRQSQNQIGVAAGVGVEFALYKRVSIDVEYLYVNFPSIKTMNFISNSQAGFGIPQQSLNSPFSTTGNLHASLFKVGLNYLFYS